MPVSLPPESVLRDVLRRYEASGNFAALAREYGKPRATLQGWVKRARELPPPAEKPRIRVKVAGVRIGASATQKPAPVTQQPPPVTQNTVGAAYRVLCIGDAHDSPDIPDKSRFYWFGRHAAETQPDYVIQVGDFLTMDSCSQHEGNATVRGKKKPSFMEDIRSGEEALSSFNRGAAGYRGKKRVTLGNHEDRAHQWENLNPEAEEMFGLRVEELFARGGWETTPYGEFFFLGGVGFTHVPFNQMGKGYGGKNPETMIANDATFDIVYGHTHKDRNHKAPKIGPLNHVRILNVGCALPLGHVERYAKKSTTGWSYGVFDLTIQSGHIQNWNFIDMQELERRYG